MLTALIPTAVSALVTISTSIAIDSAAKMIIPTTLKAAAGFAVKAGVYVGSSLITYKIGQYVSSQVSSIVDTVKAVGVEEVTPTSEDI